MILKVDRDIPLHVDGCGFKVDSISCVPNNKITISNCIACKFFSGSGKDMYDIFEYMIACPSYISCTYPFKE